MPVAAINPRFAGVELSAIIAEAKRTVANSAAIDRLGAVRPPSHTVPFRHSFWHPRLQGQRARRILAHNECETLYLVGDIIDGWQLRRGWYWTEAQTRAINLILAKAKSGTKVIYVPGNHDEMFRPYCGLSMGGIEIRFEDVFETADGRRMLVVHGDRFDGIVTYARGLAKVGAQAYEAVVALNTVVDGARRKLGLPYWSLAAYLKHKVKNAGQFIAKFERAVAAEASCAASTASSAATSIAQR